MDITKAQELRDNFINSEAKRGQAVIACDVLSDVCHSFSVSGGWWHDLESGEPKTRNKGEMLCLIHSEVSEAMEGARKGKQDDHLPHRSSEEVELADAIIRIFDYAGGHGLDVGSALVEKLQYNARRADHKPENRLKAGGKAF